MTEVSDYNHSVNIETLKNWSINDKVIFYQGGAETLGIVKSFDLSQAGSMRLVVYDFYNKQEVFVPSNYCHKI